MKKIAAIVVTYNRCELLKECISALQKSTVPVEILIVDNASTDNTAETVQALLPAGKISYFNTQKNIGGAGGFNFGMKKAYELGFDYFWLMDDDTIVEPDTLSKLLEADEKLAGNYGFLSSLALWQDGTDCHMNYHTIAMDWNLEKRRIRDGIVKVETATFVSFLTTRQVVEKVGLPIREYFIWGDDTEYSGRIAREYPCFLAGHSQVLHKMEQNIPTGRITDIADEKRIERMFYSVRNDCCTFRRIGWKNFVRYTVNTMLLFLDVLRHSREYKGRKLKIILKGYFTGVFFRPAIERVK